MENDNLITRLAWRAAYEERACPRDEILFEAQKSEELETHLGYCVFCNERLEMGSDELDAWRQLAAKLPRAPQFPQQDHASGQVWSVTKGRAGWGPLDRYYNPPMVLILEKLPDLHGLRVAQLCSEREMMGKADVWLGDHIPLFAEGWNVYTMHSGDLEELRGVVDEGTLELVREAAAQGDATVERDEIANSFRELELGVASFFSMPSVAMLVQEHEARARESLYDLCKRLFPLDAVQAALKEWRLPAGISEVFELVTSAAAPQHLAPMTAAGTTRQLQINHLRKEGGNVSVDPILVQITFCEWRDDGFLVSGSFLKALAGPVELLAALPGETACRAEVELFPGKDDLLEFDLFFRGVPRSVSELDQLQLLAVSYE